MSGRLAKVGGRQAGVQVLEDRYVEQAISATGRSTEQTEDEHKLASGRLEQVAVV